MRAVGVLVCVIVYVCGGAAGTGEFPAAWDPCGRTYMDALRLYNWCATGDAWNSQPRTLISQDSIRGRDVVSILEAFCSNITEFGQCVMNDVVTCDDDVKNLMSETVARAGSVCNGRGEVRDEVSQIFLSENPTNDEELNGRFCHEGIDYYDCNNEGEEKYGDVTKDMMIRKYKDIVKSDNYSKFYDYMFKCNRDKILATCPNNVMTMTAAYLPGLILTPRIGVNVFAILLEENST